MPQMAWITLKSSLFSFFASDRFSVPLGFIFRKQEKLLEVAPVNNPPTAPVINSEKLLYCGHSLCFYTVTAGAEV